MMATEMVRQPPLEERLLTVLAASSEESESDGGYGTPAESFAEDERSLTPPALELPAAARNSTGDELVVVDPELQERIRAQVEYYFSDENLLKDAFLMKHINRNRLGYVSLKLVASLRKVKSLSKDWRVVLASVRTSKQLALNEEENKIRRLAPPPQVDYSHAVRTLVVTGYPQSHPDRKEAEDSFRKYGDVTRVRVLLPDKAVPLDVKPYRTSHPSLGAAPCLLVEYGTKEGAWSACRQMQTQQSWRDQMRVDLLSEEPAAMRQEAEKPQKPAEKKPHRQTGEGTGKKGGGRQAGGTKHVRPARGDSTSPHQPKEGRQTRSHAGHNSGQSRQRHGAKHSADHPRKFLQPEAWRGYASDSGCSAYSPGSSPKASPEPSRQPAMESSFVSWRSSEKHTHVRDSGVVRWPSGPDGSRGFRRSTGTASLDQSL